MVRDQVEGLFIGFMNLVLRMKLPPGGGSCRKPGVLMQGQVGFLNTGNATQCYDESVVRLF